MSNPTGSAIERSMRCPASCVLGSAAYSGAAAEYGTENHEKIQQGDASKPVVRDLLEGATDVRYEVAYALNVETRTVREIGQNVGRNYGPLADTEIALTVDAEFRKDGVWHVPDWKSRERVTQARNNWQVRAAVLAVAGRHNADYVVGGIAYLDDSELDVFPFDAFHLVAFWDELRYLLVRIRKAEEMQANGETLSVSAGSWCKYCPALPYCPAHTKLAKSLLGELDSVDAAIATLTAEQCGRAWDLLKRYDVIADRVKESIRSRARHEPVPLPSGRRLALVETSRRSVDTKKAAEMLGESTPYKTSFFTQVREVNGKDDT